MLFFAHAYKMIESTFLHINVVRMSDKCFLIRSRIHPIVFMGVNLSLAIKLKDKVFYFTLWPLSKMLLTNKLN